MDDRKYFILGAVLRSYIESAEPIGSRTLQRDFDMDISAATIRNEMSDLEHLGYLIKAHTSSGRIPSSRAYRWYVDEIQEKGLPFPPIQALPTRSLLDQSSELDYVLDNALDILSETTGYLAVALIPGRTDDILRKIELIRVSDREIVLVMVYNTRVIRTDLIYLKSAYSPDRVKRTAAILQEILEDRGLVEIRDFLQSHFFSGPKNQANLLSELLPVILKQVTGNLVPQIRFKGWGRLYEAREFSSWDRTADFIKELEESEDLIGLLERETDPKSLEVYIGEESDIELLKESSLVFAPYHVKSNLIGKIGVIGPTRMQYQKVLFDVGMMGKYIDSLVDRL